MEDYNKSTEHYSDLLRSFSSKEPKSQFNTAQQLVDRAFRQVCKEYDEILSSQSRDVEAYKTKLSGSQAQIKKYETEIHELQVSLQQARDEILRLRKSNSNLKQKCEKIESLRRSIMADLQEIKVDDLDSHPIYTEPSYSSNLHLENTLSNITTSPPASISKLDEATIKTKELFKNAKGIMDTQQFHNFLQLIKKMNENQITVEHALKTAKETLTPRFEGIYNNFEEVVRLRKAASNI